MRARGPWLGDLLERRGAIARDQLLRALRNQKVVGGKLGTCLLEIDALPEEALVEALAEQQGASGVSPEELRGIQRAVLDLVPAKVARAHLVVPFRASGTQIHVAMIDARDLRALDELAFVTGRRVVAHVASEARVLEALDRYYGVECPPRFVKLLDRMNRSRFLWRTDQAEPSAEMLSWDPGIGGLRPAEVEPELPPLRSPSAPPSQPGRTPHQFVPRLPARPGPPGTAPVGVPPPPPVEPTAPAPAAARPHPAPSWPRVPAPTAPPGKPAAPAPAAVVPVPAAPPSAPPLALPLAPPTAPPPPPRLTLAEVEARLLEPEDADSVGNTLVEFAAGRARGVALFQVRRNEIAGWAAHGFDIDRLTALRIPLDRPSLFLSLREGAAVHRGPLPDLPAHAELRSLLGEETATGDLLALPLRVREKLVSVMLLAPDHGTTSPAVVAELQRVAAKGSLALELCIMRKKLRKA